MQVATYSHDYELWLSKNMHDPHDLQKLYQPFSAELMSAYKVSSLVNIPKFDAAACLKPVTPANLILTRYGCHVATYRYGNQS